MPDTAANRQAYHYWHGQKDGWAFPMVGLGGLDLGHGGLCELASSDMDDLKTQARLWLARRLI